MLNVHMPHAKWVCPAVHQERTLCKQNPTQARLGGVISIQIILRFLKLPEVFYTKRRKQGDYITKLGAKYLKCVCSDVDVS